MWRYRDRVGIRIGMGVDLSGDLCVQAPGCLGACVHVVVSVGEGSGGWREEDEEDKKREAMTSVRGRRISWEGERRSGRFIVFGAEACLYRQISFIHIPTLWTDSLSQQIKTDWIWRMWRRCQDIHVLLCCASTACLYKMQKNVQKVLFFFSCWPPQKCQVKRCNYDLLADPRLAAGVLFIKVLLY